MQSLGTKFRGVFTKVRSTVLLAALMASGCSAGPVSEIVQVEAFAKHVDRSRTGFEACEDVSMERADVTDFFRNAREVPEETFNASAQDVPCGYRGSLRDKGKVLFWNILASGVGTLHERDKGDTRRYFLCKGMGCPKPRTGG